jgi:hypothetical protein
LKVEVVVELGLKGLKGEEVEALVLVQVGA